MFSAFSPRTASAYERINVETHMHTLDQHTLVSMLLDGVLSAVTAARGALARNDIPAKCTSISKAVRILEEGLMTALDREHGGEVAANLEAVYDYALRRLIQANVANDDAMLQEVTRLIEPIAQGWKGMKQSNGAAHDVAQSTLAEA
jgi:flagellar protein FliS